MEPMPESAPPVDFDFIIGTWRVHHKRLNTRLQGCREWSEFQGTSSTKKVLGGFGNVEDNIFFLPEGQVRAAAFRSYDPNSQRWAIWWLDGRSPHQLDKPVVGNFVGNIGTFESQDVLDGKPIRVRFVWNSDPTKNPVWEQAFSADGGATWEKNWVMVFERSAA